VNKDIKAEWVAALRSGFYKQGKYQLREQGEFYDPCGVLCELAVNAGVLDPARFTPKRDDDPERSWSGYQYGTTGDNGGTGLPKAVQEWAGLAYYQGYRISIMGDKGKKFDEIADYIEKEL
jgi:hypothetical protein